MDKNTKRIIIINYTNCISNRREIGWKEKEKRIADSNRSCSGEKIRLHMIRAGLFLQVSSVIDRIGTLSFYGTGVRERIVSAGLKQLLMRCFLLQNVAPYLTGNKEEPSSEATQSAVLPGIRSWWNLLVLPVICMQIPSVACLPFWSDDVIINFSSYGHARFGRLAAGGIITVLKRGDGRIPRILV